MTSIRKSIWENEIDEIKGQKRFLRIIALILLIFEILLVLTTFVYINIQVNQTSMYPTLSDGDRLVANKLCKNIRRGDIIIIDVGSDEHYIIKRAIAFEGETVYIADGKVYINGEELEESYLPADVRTEPRTMEENPMPVKKDKIFYLGDNRAVSADSRSFGCCDKKDIVARVEPWAVRYKGLTKVLFDVSAFLRSLLGWN